MWKAPLSNIEKALPYFLKTDTALAALVVASGVARIYPYKLPQTQTLPAIVFQDISTATNQAHNEASALPRCRYQFTIYAGTVDVLYQVKEALRNRLDGYSGSMGTGAYTTEVEAVLFKNEYGNDDNEIGIYWKFQDYVIQYKR